MRCDQRPIQNTLYEMRNELTTIRGIAQLLLRRLERDPDELRSKMEACKVIIDQTRRMESSLNRVAADVREPQDWLIVDHEFASLRGRSTPEASSH